MTQRKASSADQSKLFSVFSFNLFSYNEHFTNDELVLLLLCEDGPLIVVCLLHICVEYIYFFKSEHFVFDLI